MMNGLSPMKDACGPCLSEKELKKRNAQEAKELKATINLLATKYGYDKEVSMVLGNLVASLIRLEGPLK